MNNAGTVLLTVADMSVIEAEVEVDETDIPNVQLGQNAKVTIDAMPGKTFTGKVTEIGNSPIQAAGASAASQATNFKVKVTLDGEIPDVRPGFTCTAEITTATRQQVVVGADPGDGGAGSGRRQGRQHRPRRIEGAGEAAAPAPVQDQDLKPGQSARSSKASSSCATTGRCSRRSRPGSPAKSISKCCRARTSATRSSSARSASVRELRDGAAGRRSSGTAIARRTA